MKDPVIEEIRERRRQLIREQFSGSIDSWVDCAREWEKNHPRQVVSLRKKTKPRAVA